ncbi:unnamed protein product [Lepidochelys olivacea]
MSEHRVRIIIVARAADRCIRDTADSKYLRETLLLICSWELLEVESKVAKGETGVQRFMAEFQDLEPVFCRSQDPSGMPFLPINYLAKHFKDVESYTISGEQQYWFTQHSSEDQGSDENTPVEAGSFPPTAPRFTNDF